MRAAFRADSSSEIGIGHVMRCLNLAEQGDIFICRELRGNIGQIIIEKGHEIIWLETGAEEEGQSTAEIVKRYKCDIVIIDSYTIDNNVVSYLSKNKVITAMFDDLGEREIAADIVINHNPFANADMYRGLTKGVILAGAQFTLIGKHLFNKRGVWKPKAKAGKILITLGGSDPENIGDKTAQQFINTNYNVTYITGVGNKNKEIIKQKYSTIENIRVIEQTNDLGELMINHDFTICAGGTTLWEAVYLGIDFGVIEIADNQKKSVDFVKDKNLGLSMGKAEGLNYEAIIGMIEKYMNTDRNVISEKRKNVIDGMGKERLRRFIEGYLAEKK